MKRSTFLPLFFTALTIMFGAAVWMRLSAYEKVAPAAPRDASAPVIAEGRDDSRPVADEGVIVETDSAGVERPRTVSTRQQRYNELLRAAPPAPAVSEDPSLFDRMITTPIANALGMARKPAAAAPPPPARQQQQQQQQQARAEAQSQSPRPSGDQTATSRDAGEEPDEETDVLPPKLVAVEFLPAQVSDDGETTLAATVTDNLSGVRSVSGVIASPSGALQGFACQREGETDRYVARIKIPRDAAEGTWAVKYLTLSDNANNSINISQASGSLPQGASFRVVPGSGGSDSAAPVLKSVYLERRTMNAGERNTVFVQAEDDKSGVSLVSGVFVSPSKQARIGFGCRAGTAGAWECVVAPPACLDCGTWQLEQVQLQDKANNMATFRADNQIVSQVALEITGDKCDAGPPSITQLALEPPVVSNAQGGVITIRAVVADDACGVASLSGQAVPSGSAGGQRIYFSFDPSPDGQNFTGRIIVPKHAATGTWAIGWIQALDKGHNLKAYSANDPVLARVTFRVE